MATFETIVRPFQSRPIIATRRVVPSVSDGSDTGTAVISWGKAGLIEKGAKQEDGVDLATVGFTVNCCDDTWEQKGDPETNRKRIENPDNPSNYVDVDRVRKISFENKKKGPCDSDFTSFSYTAAAVEESISGLEASIPGSKKCNASFSLTYD